MSVSFIMDPASASVDTETVTLPLEDLTNEEIIRAARRPLKMAGDEGSIQERSIDDLIKAETYVQSQDTINTPPHGMVISRLKPGGTV